MMRLFFALAFISACGPAPSEARAPAGRRRRRRPRSTPANARCRRRQKTPPRPWRSSSSRGPTRPRSQHAMTLGSARLRREGRRQSFIDGRRSTAVRRKGSSRDAAVLCRRPRGRAPRARLGRGFAGARRRSRARAACRSSPPAPCKLSGPHVATRRKRASYPVAGAAVHRPVPIKLPSEHCRLRRTPSAARRR